MEYKHLLILVPFTWGVLNISYVNTLLFGEYEYFIIYIEEG